MYTPRFVYPSVCQWTLGRFHLLSIVNNGATHVNVQVFLGDPVFSSLYMYRDAGLLGHMTSLCFNFLRNCQPVSVFLGVKLFKFI